MRILGPVQDLAARAFRRLLLDPPAVPDLARWADAVPLDAVAVVLGGAALAAAGWVLAKRCWAMVPSTTVPTPTVFVAVTVPKQPTRTTPSATPATAA
jgi:hypothetical protein